MNLKIEQMIGIKIIIQKLEVDGEEHGTVVKVFMAWKSIKVVELMSNKLS